ncbi:PP2C family serine/threonine-protein phosphatase [Cytobacillus purgationiresistens]|uniref:Negative regulator of sigma-B (Phosphoserine phosphatase) n=1 Tax=Cytobacillus purgationiresistens TaxID=863449 RepID=A0ABU0AQP6_9BACI|nr:PP2C family serine/threonine-protein phosphatase [Cytobacillus purgationiresistens]MDQ0273199.1 negative regulator of sigma-B (phosphoserine phosphatase) [Cytobacillus purgationiresistens]
MTEANQFKVITHQTAKSGQSVCGDSFYYMTTEKYFICAIADGLGSGQFAHEASSAVTAVIEEHHDKDVDTLMHLSNEALSHKRGAAVGIVKVDFMTKELIYSCVGNIRFFFYGDSDKLMYPMPVTGFLSGKRQVLKTQRFKYESSIKFLMFSDGYNISGIKKIMNKYLSAESTSQLIKANHPSIDDDATFIIGSLR